MKTLFLTSNIGSSIKENGVRKPCALENINNFVYNLSKSLPQRKLVLLFASSPENNENNDKYAGLIQSSFTMSNLQFEKSIVIDSRTKNIADLIKKANLIYLMGGLTLSQNAFFEKIQLRELLKDFNGVIIGESAGAINMATNAYENREELTEQSQWFKGLNLTPYRIEPHFNITNTELIEQTLKPDSFKQTFFALEDRSYIMVKDGISTLFGNAWLFKNGDFNKINNTNDELHLTNTELENEFELIKQ